MEPENLTPIMQPVTQPEKKRGKNILTITLVLIAIFGLGFGGYEFYQNTTKNSEIKNLKSQLATSTDTDKPTVDNSDVPSVASAEKLLENYVGAGSRTSTFLNAFYDTFVVKYDNNQKAYLAYSSVKSDEKNTVTCAKEYHEKGACTTKSIGYDLINKKYQSLFGNSANIKKENYAFHNFFYLVYNSKTNAYDEYILQGGGVSPVVALHKVISTKSSEDGFIATVSFIEMNLDVEFEVPSGFPGGLTAVSVKDEAVNDAVKSMAIYEFEFSKNGDSYVLKDVTKLGSE